MEKIGSVPKHLEPIRQRVNRIIALHNKAPSGILLGDGKTTVVTRQPDGRYVISLHPNITNKFQ